MGSLRKYIPTGYSRYSQVPNKQGVPSKGGSVPNERGGGGLKFLKIRLEWLFRVIKNSPMLEPNLQAIGMADIEVYAD